MKTKFGILIAYVLSILLILHYPITVLAESGTNQGGAYTNGADTSTADKQQFSVKNDGLEFTVTYPKTIQCGSPTTFEFDAKYDNDPNVSNGEFKYRIHSLTVYDGFENVSVYDVSYGLNSQYTPQNTFNFTFYASGTYYIRFEACYRTPNPDGQTYKMITVNTGFLNEGIVLNINDSRYPSVENIVANIANECLKQCSTDYEKALWLNDWIVDHCQYDNTFSYCSAEGALARGTGTCEAYHRAYVMLLNRVGISTGRITGNGHVWTAVKMNGKWYQVDTTWNDPGYPEPNIDLRHLYFGLNDEIMKKVHSDHTPVQGYESTSLEQNYFIQSKEILKWANPVINKVREHITARDTSFSIEINKKNSNDSDYASSYATILYNLVSHVLTNMSWSDNEALNINLNAVYNPVDSSSGSIECTVQYDTIPLSFQQVSLATDSVNIGTNAQLSYAVNRNATVTVQVFDTNNQCLQTLVSNKAISTEEQVVQWNLKNNAGTYVPNGSYHFTITAKDSFGNSLVKHKYFNVYSPLKSIALNYTNLTMDKGNQKQLSVSYNPSNTTDSKSIKWSTSNASIAKVDGNGKVTAVSPGTATIYANCNGKVATCLVSIYGNIQFNGFTWQVYDDRILIGSSYNSNDDRVRFTFKSYNLDTKTWSTLGENKVSNWQTWYPEKGNYWIYCEALLPNGYKISQVMCFAVDKNYAPYVQLNGFTWQILPDRINIGSAYYSNDSNVKFTFKSYNLDTHVWTTLGTNKSSNWQTWTPTKGNYWIYCEATTSTGYTANQVMCFAVDKNYGPYVSLDGFTWQVYDDRINIGVAYTSNSSGVKFTFKSYNLDTKVWSTLGENKTSNWQTWTPAKGNYWIYCEALLPNGYKTSQIMCFAVDKNY